MDDQPDIQSDSNTKRPQEKDQRADKLELSARSVLDGADDLRRHCYARRLQAADEAVGRGDGGGSRGSADERPEGGGEGGIRDADDDEDVDRVDGPPAQGVAEEHEDGEGLEQGAGEHDPQGAAEEVEELAEERDADDGHEVGDGEEGRGEPRGVAAGSRELHDLRGDGVEAVSYTHLRAHET